MCQITPIETETHVVTGPQVFTYFPTLIYTDKKPEFLDVVREVSDEYIEKAKADHDLNEIYPVYMTGSFYDDPRLAAFSQAVGQAAWDVLSGQGYNMNGLSTYFTEMWSQQHYKHSSMEQHVHGFGSQIVGFYFTQTPEDCSRVLFHDPRAGKVMINLPEADMGMATPASSTINFKPEPGMLIFTNAWLAHSFTRHAAVDPIQFVHFNLSIRQDMPHVCPVSAAEVI
jgi:uncharacterized protein (TIGR02466 family)